MIDDWRASVNSDANKRPVFGIRDNYICVR